jgi:carbonic anhydrase
MKTASSSTSIWQVEYIVVIGHSRCAGIRELLSLKDKGPNA